MQGVQSLGRKARDALAGSWGRACAASLLLVSAWFLLTMLEWAFVVTEDVRFLVDTANTPALALDDVPNASAAGLWSVSLSAGLSYLLLTPLSLGLTRWCWQLTGGGGRDVSQMLLFFSSGRLFRRALVLRAAAFCRCALWAALFLGFPVGALWLSLRARGSAKSPWFSLLSGGAALTSVVLGLLLLCILWWFCQRYALAYAALAADEGCTVHKALRRSVRAMRGHNGELVRLKLRLLGWRLAELLVLPALWTLPYRRTVYALYARERLAAGGRTDSSQP